MNIEPMILLKINVNDRKNAAKNTKKLCKGSLLGVSKSRCVFHFFIGAIARWSKSNTVAAANAMIISEKLKFKKYSGAKTKMKCIAQ